jgi:hypothetical protein
MKYNNTQLVSSDENRCNNAYATNSFIFSDEIKSLSARFRTPQDANSCKDEKLVILDSFLKTITTTKAY